jgi:isopenicillin N synthase-like dioxygenase
MESKSFMTATDVETVRRSILEEIPNCEANISNSGDIPVIDAAPIRQYAQDHQATEAWQKSVADLDYALREVGFFSLANHGLDAGPAKAVSESFFQQPITTKMKQAQRPDFQFGYTAAGAEKLFLSEDEYDGDDSLQKTGDPKESLNIPPLHLPWRWPADSKNFDADRFRTTMTQYFEDCTTFSSELMQTLAVVLGEEADFFEDANAVLSSSR